jgi:hypothetical protein
MAQDCFALSGLTDCTVSTSQGVALGWFVPALRAEEPPLRSERPKCSRFRRRWSIIGVGLAGSSEARPTLLDYRERNLATEDTEDTEVLE